MTSIRSLLAGALTDFLDGLFAAIPRALSGFIFLGLAYVTVRIVLTLVRTSVGQVYVGDRDTNIIFVLAPVNASSVTETSSQATLQNSDEATPTSSAVAPGFGVGVALLSLLLGLALLMGRRSRS